MGQVEKKSGKRLKKANLQRIILGTLLAAGTLSVALLAPNVITALKKLEKGNRRRSNPIYSARRSIDRLRESGLIAYEKTSDGTFVRLTNKGERKLRSFDPVVFYKTQKKKWDGRWRIVIFDIKESRRKTRDKLRGSLMQIGFLRLQDSVWIFPYDCEDLIILLKADFTIGKDVLYMIVDTLENDVGIKKHFGLEK